jgi:hypothetical protein
MRTIEEPRPARWRHQARPKYRIIKAALAVTAGLLLAAAFTTASAQAAVTSTAKTIGTMQPKVIPETLKTCETGTNNSYEYYGWCDGTGPTSYRTVAYCENGDAVLGLERWDGDRRLSYSSCELNGMNSTLDADWGYLLCSNNNGAGTYQGYSDKHGDISWILYDWGNGNITTGGTTLCEWDTSAENVINPNTAPPAVAHLRSAARPQ